MLNKPVPVPRVIVGKVHHELIMHPLIHPVMLDVEAIVRRQDQECCASITSMIRHYVARRAQVTEDHPHNAAFGALGQTRRGPGGRGASATTVSACGGQQIAHPLLLPGLASGYMDRERHAE